MSHIEDLLQAVDEHWRADPAMGRILLKVIGQTALFLQTGYERGTKDGDVLETKQVSGAVRAQLEQLAGKGSRIALQCGIYIDVVGAAIPLLPSDSMWHCYPMNLAHFDVVMLDVADVLVSKLIRYAGTDRDDVRAMIDGEHVEHGVLRERFELVIERYQFDGRGDHLPEMVERFNEIERDQFLVEETQFELHPSVYS